MPHDPLMQEKPVSPAYSGGLDQKVSSYLSLLVDIIEAVKKLADGGGRNMSN